MRWESYEAEDGERIVLVELPDLDTAEDPDREQSDTDILIHDRRTKIIDAYANTVLSDR